MARPLVQVDHGAGDERVGGLPDLVLDHLRGRRDPLAVERRQHHPAVRAVVGAVGRQQPVAEQHDQAAQLAVAPGEVLGAGDEDVVVGLRPEHEDDVVVKDPQREDRPVALVGVDQHAHRVLDEARSCAAC